MLGDAPTIVDFSMAGYVYYPPEETGFDIEAAFPAVHASAEEAARLSAQNAKQPAPEGP